MGLRSGWYTLCRPAAVFMRWKEHRERQRVGNTADQVEPLAALPADTGAACSTTAVVAGASGGAAVSRSPASAAAAPGFPPGDAASGYGRRPDADVPLPAGAVALAGREAASPRGASTRPGTHRAPAARRRAPPSCG